MLAAGAAKRLNNSLPLVRLRSAGRPCLSARKVIADCLYDLLSLPD